MYIKCPVIYFISHYNHGHGHCNAGIVRRLANQLMFVYLLIITYSRWLPNANKVYYLDVSKRSTVKGAGTNRGAGRICGADPQCK
jgi:hypothetical protein